MIPRDYQQEAVNAARSRTAAHGNTILMLPTGAGKTAVAGFYIGEEVQAQVGELLKSAFSGGNPLPLTSQLLLTRTSRVGLEMPGGLGYATIGAGALSSPFSNIEVRMVPENVTNLPKAGVEAKDTEERLVLIRKSESIEDVLRTYIPH